jgi:glycosyltransferase involved in cell wall biosynthesis
MNSGAQPKRLCVVCPQSPTDMGGIETIVRNLHNLYSSIGYEVHVVTGAPRSRVTGFRFVHSYALANRLLTQFIWPLTFGLVVVLAARLTFLQLRFRYAALLPQDNYLQGLAACIAGRLTCCPVIVMDHGTATNISDPRWQTAWRARHSRAWEKLLWPCFSAGVRLQPFVFRAVAHLASRVFYTGYELDEFYDEYKMPLSKRYKYEHILDTEFFSGSASARVELRIRYGVPVDAFVVCCASRLNFEKGHDSILRAVAALKRTASGPVRLLVAGDDLQVAQRGRPSDGTKAALLELMAELDITREIVLMGVLDEGGVRDLNRVADVHVYAGIMGCSFALCVLEAMACGVPCIVTPVPRKLADVITANMGWVVAPNSPKELEAALAEAYQRRSSLASMGAAAREYSLAHNSYDAMRATYVRVLEVCT